MADILGAVYDFLQRIFPEGFTCADGRTAPISQSVIRAAQNRVSLPPYSEIIILTLLNAVRHGTNVHMHRYLMKTDTLQEDIKMLTEYTVQIDCIGEFESDVMQRANTIAIVARDAFACDFFRPYKILPLYAEDVRNLTFIDEQKQWRPRYSVVVHFETWNEHRVSQDYFNAVDVEIENVDVHHPVTG